jgi:hypothetical protein
VAACCECVDEPSSSGATELVRAILEKLVVAYITKKFPKFYGTLRFFTVLIGARHRVW